MRRMKARLVTAVLLGSALGCSADTGGGAVALRDPLGLVDDVFASGNPLRLYVLPGDGYACDPTTGRVSPEVQDLAVGALPDAVVDVSLTQDELGGRDVSVPVGAWTVLVRGKGTDVASGRMGVPIATGCASTSVGNGETVEVRVTLAPVVGMGLCADGILSPDEQCEPSMGAPECGMDCRTVAEAVNSTLDGAQSTPRAAARPGQNVAVVWGLDMGSFGVGLRYLDPSGRPTLRGPQAVDTTFDLSSLAPLPGSQQEPSLAVAADGRVGIALWDLTPAGAGDVKVGFFGGSGMALGATRPARTDAAGLQQAPSIAFSSDGRAMVVFQDSRSATGLSGRVFDATGTVVGDEAFEVGTGQTSGTAPQVAAAGSGFVVAFVAGDNIHAQRFGADGSPTDAAAIPVDAAGSARSAPALAALTDGSFLVAYTEQNAMGDGMGSGIRARIFPATGMPTDAAFLVNSTVAGDQSQPSVAAAGSRFLVAFSSNGSVRGAIVSAGGDPSLNRERPPTLGDFEVAPSGATAPSATVVGTGATQAWWIAYQAPGAGGLPDVFARRIAL